MPKTRKNVQRFNASISPAADKYLFSMKTYPLFASTII
uniref:Uncharacterized protein n=1 Tax=viral metagenome TaxID=1070528 RepID=A0A6C0AH61_9ZZZZ